ncbi:unnamed protein product [Rhizopus microsporus]
MFQSKAYIERRHGKNSANRSEYLEQLINEYKTTKDKAKQQVLAHLANFAYDPINYDHLWNLYAVNLFLEAITDPDPLLREFGMGGLANICLEPRHYEYIMSQPSFRQNIISCLDNTWTKNIKVNAMTTLMLLITEENYSGNKKKRILGIIIFFFFANVDYSSFDRRTKESFAKYQKQRQRQTDYYASFFIPC